MRIPTGEIKPELDELGKILVDGKLLVRSIFSLTCSNGLPKEKELVTRSVLPVAQLQIKRRYNVGICVVPKLSIVTKIQRNRVLIF